MGEGDAGDRDVLVRFRGMWYWKGDLQPIVVDFIVREPSNSRAKFTRISINLFYILTFLCFIQKPKTDARSAAATTTKGRQIYRFYFPHCPPIFGCRQGIGR